MKKLCCALFSLLLLAGLASCGQVTPAAPAVPDGTDLSPDALPAESAAAPLDPTEGLSGAEVPDAPADPGAQAALEALLAEIRQNVSIATAGSSLRSAIAAARLLDWAEEAQISDGQILAALSPWLEEQDDQIPAAFSEQLAAVQGSCAYLREADEQAALGLLSDAGCDDCGYPWSERAFSTAERIFALAGLPDAPEA